MERPTLTLQQGKHSIKLYYGYYKDSCHFYSDWYHLRERRGRSLEGTLKEINSLINDPTRYLYEVGDIVRFRYEKGYYLDHPGNLTQGIILEQLPNRCYKVIFNHYISTMDNSRYETKFSLIPEFLIEGIEGPRNPRELSKIIKIKDAEGTLREDIRDWDGKTGVYPSNQEIGYSNDYNRTHNSVIEFLKNVDL